MSAAEGPFLARFGFLFPPESWAPDRLRELLGSLALRRYEPGAVIMRPGEACQALPLVLAGAIRVFSRAENGREIGLYRVEEGEACLLSSACLGGGKPFPATASAEGKLSLALMPAARAHALISESPEFRDYMFARLAQKLSGIMELVQEVAFSRVDERLERWLGANADGEGRIDSTHQDIAAALGTSREVVSRILKDWEGRGRLSLSRGGLTLLEAFQPGN